jgi:hypothetical protein
MRKCWRCGKTLDPNKQETAKFCSSRCGSKRHWENVRSDSKAKGSNLGAESELLVSADLLHKGFEVYRNVSPWGSSDLVVKRGSLLFTVEVRTGYLNKKGEPTTSKERMKSDILAIVVNGPRIVYKPELPSVEEKTHDS